MFTARQRRSSKLYSNEPEPLDKWWTLKLCELPADMQMALGVIWRRKTVPGSTHNLRYDHWEAEGWAHRLMEQCINLEMKAMGNQITGALRSIRGRDQTVYKRLMKQLKRRAWVRFKNTVNKHRDDFDNFRTDQINNLTLVELDLTEL